MSIRRIGALPLVPLAVFMMGPTADTASALAVQTRQTQIVARECDTCRLTARRVLSIGDADGPGTIDFSSAGVLEDGRGNLLVTTPPGDEIKVFSGSGRYLETIGRAGAEPSEFRGISAWAVGPGDSIYILDANNARLSVWSPDYKLRRSSRISYPLHNIINLIAMESGEMLIVGRMRTPERAGFPAHLIDRDGRIIRSFGSASGGDLRPDIQYMDSRAIEPASRPGRVWLAYRNKYEIELWDVSGKHISTVVRRADWFKDWFVPGESGRDPDGRPRPRIATIYDDNGETLFIALSVADPEWKQAIAPSDNPYHTVEIKDPVKYRDTIIEAIDLATGRVLGSIRFDNAVTKFLSRRRVAGVEYDASGIPRVVVWQLTVAGANQ